MTGNFPPVLHALLFLFLIKDRENLLSPGGKDGRCVRLTTLTLSCPNCLEILEPQPPGTPRPCPGL